MKTYILPGKPIPLARPRLCGKIVFDSQKSLKMSLGTYLNFMTPKDYEPLTGPLQVSLKFFMPKPKSFKGSVWHHKRPDIDNLVKFYLDVANGILYEDDAQIAVIDAVKLYADEPRTEIVLTELNSK